MWGRRAPIVLKEDGPGVRRRCDSTIKTRGMRSTGNVPGIADVFRAWVRGQFSQGGFADATRGSVNGLGLAEFPGVKWNSRRLERGPHLHFELYDSTEQARFDPFFFVGTCNKTFKKPPNHGGRSKRPR